MSLYEPVPKVDLPPELQPSHDLSYRNPEDYVRLLFWAFWRPHSLEHYLTDRRNRWSNGANIANNSLSLEISYPTIISDLYRLTTYLAAILTSFVCLLYWLIAVLPQVQSGSFLQSIGTFILALCAGNIVAFFSQIGIHFLSRVFFPNEWTDITVVLMLIFGIIWGITSSIFILYPTADDIVFRSALLSMAIGSTLGFVLSTPSYYIEIERTQKILIWITVAILLFVILTVVVGGLRIDSVFLLSVSSISILASFLVTAFRIDDWFFGQLLKGRAISRRDARLLPRVTPIPIWGLRLELEDWLDWDWQAGLDNIQLIRKFTRQDLMTALAIRQILKESSENKDKMLTSKVEQLQSTFRDIDLRHFSPAKLSDNTPINVVRQAARQILGTTQKGNGDNGQKGEKEKTRKAERQKHRQRRWGRSQVRRKLQQEYETSTLADSAIAAYSYLSLYYPEKAIPAFQKLSEDDLGKEMVEISKALTMLWFEENLPESAPLTLPQKPENPRHREVWQAFEKLAEVVRYVWILRRTRDATNYALMSKLLLEELSQILAELPDTHVGDTLRHIATDWQREVASLINTIGSEKVKKSENPFIYVEPLNINSKGLLKGRSDQLDLIEAAWKVGNFQPLLIHGQRLIGKTSLIRCAEAKFSRKVRLATVNLKQLEMELDAIALLHAICDAVGGLRIHPPPTREQLNSAPGREFRQYIHETASRLGATGLVIVLDGLEHLDRIESNVTRDLPTSDKGGNILKQSIQQLWSLAEMDPNLGLILTTSLSPSEFINNNQQTPLASTVQPISIGYLSKTDIASLLRSPTPKFLPYCTDEGIDRIFYWTSGHPYLTQLLAYCLVEHYNAQVSALNGQRDPLFTPIDIDGTIQQHVFRRQSERYCQEIREEAVTIDGSTIDILDALKSTQHGLTDDELEQELGSVANNSIMHQLAAHQIIELDGSRWRIIVELFRVWL